MEMIGRRLSSYGHPATVVDVKGLDGSVMTIDFEAGCMKPAGFNLVVVVEGPEGLRLTEFPETIPMEYPKSVTHWNPHLPALTKEQAADLYLDALKARKEQERARVAEQARKDQETARLKEAFQAARPSWAVAAIVAELREDDSDSMTDYYSHSTTRRVVIAWSKHKRNNFKEFRKAAATFEPTADLATAEKSAEHRENWSMGGGYYLKDGNRHGTGWAVKKDGYCMETGAMEIAEHLQPGHKPEKAPKAAAAPAEAISLDGVRIVENTEKNGIELYFDDKPSEEVRAAIKAARFRWHRRGKYWYAKATAERVALVDQLFGIEEVQAVLA